MPSFLLLDKCRTFHGLTGQLLPGGEVRFFVAGTTTPADVFGDRDLTTNNGDTIALDASGRLAHECWADTTDAFFAEIYDSDDVKQGEISYMEVPGGSGQVIPVPGEGQALGGDGTNFLLLDPFWLPDPAGNSGKLLGSDGAAWLPVARPSDGAAGTSDTSTSATGYTIGNKRVQWGTGSGTNSGGRTQNATITFPLAFSATPNVVDVVVTNSSLSSFGNMPSHSITSKSTTGFTVKFTMGELDDSGSGFDFTAGVTFDWTATGPK